jgi:hypothetical protein
MANARLRLGVFAAVTAGHAALFIVVATVHLTATPTAELETSMILFALPANKVPLQPAPLPTRPERATASQHTRPPAAALQPREKVPERLQNNAPVAIDWAKEAERAAAREIEEAEAAARRAAALAHEKTPSSLALPPPPSPQFGWSHAATHRLESFPGGLILNLTDRCAIVFSIMLIPVCKMGVMEPRGDLFEHMHDPPLLGAPPTDAP